MTLRRSIRLAIAGLGNCASALLQGIDYYKHRDPATPGLLYHRVGEYTVDSIVPAACFDIDKRKVGKRLSEAAFQAPNCAARFQKELTDWDVSVQMAPVLDGVSGHMSSFPPACAFRVSDSRPVNVAQTLREKEIDVLVCYMPVGSQHAVEHFSQACLDAGVAMVNCVPVFIASDVKWAEKFGAAGIPIIGDDIKSQFGATIVHRTLVRLLEERGVALQRTYQLNTGGNTDFLNMLERARLATKKLSKTEAVQSQLNTPLDDENIHIGPSDYVAWQQDNKVAFLRLECEGFGGTPLSLEMRLSVEDSPNSAGVVIDAIRAAKLASDRKQGGPLEPACAFFMKHPPNQMPDVEAHAALDAWIASEALA